MRLVLAVVFSLSSFAALADSPEEIMSPIEKVFIPNGFDDNDNVEIVVQGNYRNNCYRTGNAYTQIFHEERTILVKATSLKYENPLCLELVTPYIQTIKLGVLKAGTYTIHLANDPSREVSIVIKERTTEAADDYLYAPVASVEVIKNDNGTSSLELEGQYPMTFIGCAKMESVKTTMDEDLVIVQPVMQIAKDVDCIDYKHDFKVQVNLDRPFNNNGLVHVRVLNGNSINRFVNLND